MYSYNAAVPSIELPQDGQDFRAEIRGNTFHLILVAAHTSIGPAASVYDARDKKWLSREWADDMGDAMRKAEAIAGKRLRHIQTQEPMPQFQWLETSRNG